MTCLLLTSYYLLLITSPSSAETWVPLEISRYDAELKRMESLLRFFVLFTPPDKSGCLRATAAIGILFLLRLSELN